MSDNLSQHANQELEAALPIAQAESIESKTEVPEELQEVTATVGEATVTADAEVDQHNQFDDASDDFAYEAADEDEMAEDVKAEHDSAPHDDDADDDAEMMSEFMDDEDGEGLDEEFDPPAHTRGVAAAGSVESNVSSADSSNEDLSDGDNDPSPQAKPKRDHSKHAAQFEPQRLAKILAAAGIDARRKCEEYVTAGRVTVDGQTITDLAFRADPFSQKIELDGEKVKLQRKVYFVLNKPRGVVCTNHDPAGRPRIIDLFPQFKERLFTIGRLDEESEGLILVTNDGELANRMAHPRYRVPKFYLCHVKGVPSSETLAALKRGMYFEEGRFSVEGVRMKKVVGGSSYLDIVLNEGQNREIRRLLAKVDHKVMRLKRVGFGPIRLGDLPSGAFRPLTTEESKLLKDLSEQRAHLDRPVSRGRNKKPRGGKPAYGSKPSFGSKPAYGRSVPAYGKSTYGAKPEFPAKRSYGDKVRSRQVTAQHGDEGINVTDEGSTQIDRSPRRPIGGDRPRGYSQSGGYGQRPTREEQRPQRRLVQATENDDTGSPQGELIPQRRYGNRPSQGEYSQRPQTDDRRPPRRSQSSDEGQSFPAEGEFTPQRRYGNRPPQGEYNQRPQTGERRPPRRYQSNEADYSNQVQSSGNDSDFNGGRRRVNDQQQEAEYTPRPQRQYRPQQQEGSYTPRPPRGQGPPPQGRPQQRRYGSQEGNSGGGYSGQRRYGTQEGNTGERSGGYSNQRRPVGNRGYSQSGPPSGPPRGRGQRSARPPRPTTADGKEILEGKVTGYRTPPKEGLPRRPYKAVVGMKVNREQRQHRRKKSDG